MHTRSESSFKLNNQNGINLGCQGWIITYALVVRVGRPFKQYIKLLRAFFIDKLYLKLAAHLHARLVSSVVLAIGDRRHLVVALVKIRCVLASGPVLDAGAVLLEADGRDDSS